MRFEGIIKTPFCAKVWVFQGSKSSSPTPWFFAASLFPALPGPCGHENVVSPLIAPRPVLVLFGYTESLCLSGLDLAEDLLGGALDDTAGDG